MKQHEVDSGFSVFLCSSKDGSEHTEVTHEAHHHDGGVAGDEEHVSLVELHVEGKLSGVDHSREAAGVVVHVLGVVQAAVEEVAVLTEEHTGTVRWYGRGAQVRGGHFSEVGQRCAGIGEADFRELLHCCYSVRSCLVRYHVPYRVFHPPSYNILMILS